MSGQNLKSGRKKKNRNKNNMDSGIRENAMNTGSFSLPGTHHYFNLFRWVLKRSQQGE
jgi:hypothetical protein